MERAPGPEADREEAHASRRPDVDPPSRLADQRAARLRRKLGSVRKDGNRLRVTAQLIKAEDGYHMWSETYDRELESVFAIQDEIATAVVAALRLQLLGADLTAEETDPEAYSLYLQGRYSFNQGAADDWNRSADAYRRALEIDAEYAPAWAGLAMTYAYLTDFGALEAEEGRALASSSAERSVALDPSLAAGWASLSLIRWGLDWDWARAATAIQTALRLEPGNVDVVSQASRLAGTVGRIDDAVTLARRAVALDPLDLRAKRNLAMTLLDAGRLEEAEAASRQLLALDPEYPSGRMSLARVLLRQGRPEAAQREMEQETDVFWKAYGMPLALHVLDRDEEADESLAALIDEYGAVGAYQIGGIHAGRGDADGGFRWLDRAYAQRDGGMAYLLTDRMLAPLHDDPRWEPLLERMGLLQYWRDMKKGEAAG